jgi:DnaJ-class molecular chaperone with C-terminal Zn finger domain
MNFDDLRHFKTGDFSFEDIFEEFFVGGSSKRRATKTRTKGEDITYSMTLPFEVVIKGGEYEITITRQVGYRARIRNHGHSCFLCEIVIRSQFHTTYEPEA